MRDSCTSPVEALLQNQFSMATAPQPGNNTFQQGPRGQGPSSVDLESQMNQMYEQFLSRLRSNMVDHVTMTDDVTTPPGDHRHKVVPPGRDSGTNTPTIRKKNRETETASKETKHCGTYTFIPTIEKATYMAQPVVISTGTSTPAKTTATKKLNTPVKQYVNSSTNTPAQGRALEVPSAFRGSRFQQPITVSRGTNTQTKKFQDTGSDVIKETLPTTNDVGVLKRPHTLTRGVGTLKIKQTSQGTDPGTPETLAPLQQLKVETHEVGCTADLPSPRKDLVDRESSPMPPSDPIVHRATSSLSLHLVDRESSPVRSVRNLGCQRWKFGWC